MQILTRVVVVAIAATCIACCCSPSSALGYGPGALDKTGLNLGVWVYQTRWGMKVDSVYRNTPAWDVGMRRGDIVMSFKVKNHGLFGGYREYQTKSLRQLREAKSQIGPNRWIAVKVWRPGHGYWYPWLEFQIAAGGGAACKMKGETAESRGMFEGDSTQDFPPSAEIRPRRRAAGEFPPEP